MKKLINIRLPVVIACAITTGVALGYIFKFYGLDLLWLLLLIPAFAIILIVLTIIKKSYAPLLFIISLIIFLFCGVISCYAKLTEFETNQAERNVSYAVSGIVEEKHTTDDYQYIIIKDVSLNNERINGKICAYLPDKYGDFCDIGYKVYFDSTLNKKDLFPYGKLNYSAQENIKYTCYIEGNLIAEYRFSLFGTIRARIRKILYENTAPDTAAICYAMLTGNSYDIENDAMQSFRYGGIAHIFAVSGLHIGIVYSIIAFFCKKLRINKYFSSAVCIFFLFFYSGICGFTLSSVRAAIMCAAHLITKILMQKSDNFNALALSFTAITLTNPLNLFSVGFQLSVCAVGGTFMLSKNIEHYMLKIKIPRNVSSKLGATFGAQLGTLPVMMANFGYISGAGLILNLLILPILSMLFVVIFVGVTISVLIIPLAPFIITYAVLPMEATLSFLLTAGFEKALITGFGAGAFAFIYFIAICFLSDKFNLKFLYRSIAVVSSIIFLVSYVLCQKYYPVKGFKIIVSASNEYGEVIIKSSEGTVLIITEDSPSSDILNTLNNNYSTCPNAIIVLGGEECIAILDKVEINCNNVYAYKLYLNIQPYDTYKIHYEQQFTICGIDFTYLDGYSILANCDGIQTGICSNETIPITNCDLLISVHENKTCDSRQTVYFGLSGYEYNIYDFGELKFELKDNEFTLLSLLPKRN